MGEGKDIRNVEEEKGKERRRGRRNGGVVAREDRKITELNFPQS